MNDRDSDRPDRQASEPGWWFAASAFVASVFAFMPLCLVGLRTFVAVDLNQAGYPYGAVSPEFVDRPTLQTDQIEWIPWLVSFWDQVRAGNFPLWTHAVAGGSPHGTMPYLGTMSPFNLSFAFLPDWYALNVGVALSFIASQWGMYLMTRRWGAGVVPATIAGVLYGFTGTYLALVHRVTAIVLAPLIIWAVDRLIDRPNGRRVAVVGALLTWSWLAGFPSGFVYSIYLAGAFALWMIVERWLAERGIGLASLTPWRVGATAAAISMGTAGSAITLLPFATEAIDRGALTERVWGANDHMPTLNLFGLFDQAAIGDAVHGPWFAGWNPIETSSQIGFIGLLFVAGFLALAVVGKVQILDRSRAAWRFLCSLAVVTTVLVWLGGPLLWLAYRLPGLGSGPIQRLRYFLALAIAGLFALGLEAFWQSNSRSGGTPDARSAPRISSAVTLAFFVVVFAWHTPAYWDLMNQWGQRRNVGVAVIAGLVLTGLAGFAAVQARREPGIRLIAGGVLAGLVFLQAWYPFRDLTPQTDPDWFYTETAAHDAVRSAADDRYRFLAPGAANFYPNGSQVYDLIDLRGVSVYHADFKRVVEVASPDAFRRDPFKITSTADEWDFSSPILDDLAIGVVALDPVTYMERARASGTATPDEPMVDGYVPTSQLAGTTTMIGSGAATQAQIAILRRGDCANEKWQAIVSRGDDQLIAASGWLVDVPSSDFGSTVTFPVDLPDATTQTTPSIDVVMPFNDRCEAAVGITSERTVSVNTSNDTDAMELISTSEAAVYRRPSAKELVWSTGDWAVTATQDEALALVGSGTTGVVTATAPAPQPDAVAATILDFELLDDRVTATVDAETSALVVVAQHLANGWKASVDGTDVDLVAVHGALAGLFVEPGLHQVELRYEPSAFAWGWKISLAAAVAAIALAAINPKPGLKTLGREPSDELGERLAEIPQERPEPTVD